MTGLEYVRRRDLHPYWDESRDPNREDVADAYEQGKADGYNEGLDAGARWADEHPRWISVEDELPEACVAVLTTTQNGTQRVGCYEDGWWLANSPDLVRMGSITHWMPLPQPPVLSNSENTGRDLKGGEQ